MITSAAKGLLWTLVLSIQVISYGSYTILVHLCEENGQIQFNASSMNLLIELIKLKISLLAYAFNRLTQTSTSTRPPKPHYHDIEKFTTNPPSITKRSKHLRSAYEVFRSSLGFSAPAFLYFVNNNLAVYIQLYMDSTSYQMLSNLKILTTACLYYTFFGRTSLTRSKCLALLLLFLAGLIYTVANLKSLSSYYLDELDLQSLFSSFDLRDLSTPKSAASRHGLKFRLRDQIYITEVGFLMMCVYCLFSGLSGVYNEYLLKRAYSECIHLQNAYLYSYGCVFNLIGYFFEATYMGRTDNNNINGELSDVVGAVAAATSPTSSVTRMGGDFFAGFSVFTWAIVVTQVLNGFLMSLVMKHSSNITRLFVISCSLVVTTVLSVLVFSLKLNVYFYFCFSIIMISLYLYIK